MPWSAYAANLDGDGYLDAISANRNDDEVSIMLKQFTFVCGDATGDQIINLLDILYLIAYKYNDPPGPAPNPMEAGDANADGNVNLIDILYLIAYKYNDPPGPDPLCP